MDICLLWVLSARCLYDELITHPEESYGLWCVVVCDLETSRMMRPWHALGRSATAKKNQNDYQWVELKLFNFLVVTSSRHSSHFRITSPNKFLTTLFSFLYLCMFNSYRLSRFCSLCIWLYQKEVPWLFYIHLLPVIPTRRKSGRKCPYMISLTQIQDGFKTLRTWR